MMKNKNLLKFILGWGIGFLGIIGYKKLGIVFF